VQAYLYKSLSHTGPDPFRGHLVFFNVPDLAKNIRRLRGAVRFFLGLSVSMSLYTFLFRDYCGSISGPFR
jgi:hypothetical protein